ncbi:hypothetical protein DL766_010341 [Monosporascus sp. MC13-8B]|uniref:Clock-controlled protein 6 n=1 Tax=Monosporascus cannonballus TaxID=155416 RepID=A0ABY0HJL8_9PEZI|nr:hypothetical protein DL763_004739 [Monosporascus cannonballus]RYO94017.1 hypothetical protein DL762_000765 [Monosporascus cannonballus]RYP02443.1 hypothetical protein DL766_010341 [Monosporascus sp. MC13-8B]
MKTFAAALALAAGVSASYPVGGNVTYATEVVTSYETYCPGPTTLTYGQTTYTVSSATTLTITNCPGGCTVTKPVYTTSSVVCKTCGEHPTSKHPVYPTETPVYPTKVPTTEAPDAPTTYPTVAPPTNYPNTTIATSVTSEYPVVPTGGVTTAPTPENPTAIPTAGAGKLAAGAGLAGLMGLVALL